MKLFNFGKVLVLALIVVLLVCPLLMGAAPVGEGIPFFEGYSAESLYLLVVAAIFGLSQGLWPGVSIYNLLKNWLKIEDRAAHYAVMLFSGIIAAVSLFVTGEINFLDMSLTLQNLLSLGGVIYGMSQIGYQQFKADHEPS